MASENYKETWGLCFDRLILIFSRYLEMSRKLYIWWVIAIKSRCSQEFSNLYRHRDNASTSFNNSPLEVILGWQTKCISLFFIALSKLSAPESALNMFCVVCFVLFILLILMSSYR